MESTNCHRDSLQILYPQFHAGDALILWPVVDGFLDISERYPFGTKESATIVTGHLHVNRSLVVGANLVAEN